MQCVGILTRESTYLLTLIATASTTFEAKDVLTNALTAEGGIFVAFSLAFALTAPSAKGRHPFFAQAWFGWLVVLAIAVVALSAAAAWWDLYAHSFPASKSGRVQAIGLLTGIAVQPIFAACINWQAKR